LAHTKVSPIRSVLGETGMCDKVWGEGIPDRELRIRMEEKEWGQ
jgi:hypothetical protein